MGNTDVIGPSAPKFTKVRNDGDGMWITADNMRLKLQYHHVTPLSNPNPQQVDMPPRLSTCSMITSPRRSTCSTITSPRHSTCSTIASHTKNTALEAEEDSYEPNNHCEVDTCMYHTRRRL